MGGGQPGGSFGGGGQVGQFGVAGGGGWHKIGLNIIHQISFMAFCHIIALYFGPQYSLYI